MQTEIMNQILEIEATVETEKEYRGIWREYQRSFDALMAFMNTMDIEHYYIVDDYIWAFFDVHMQMMELALQKNKGKPPVS